MNGRGQAWHRGCNLPIMAGSYPEGVAHRNCGCAIIPMDISSVTRENWGMALLVRTGPAEYVKQIMDRFRELGMESIPMVASPGTARSSPALLRSRCSACWGK